MCENNSLVVYHNMSVKNKLQEYFQKKGKKLPLYSYTRYEKENSNPIWKCTVEFWTNEVEGAADEIFEFTSEKCTSKKEASIQAAEMALEEINKLERRMVSLKLKDRIVLREDFTHTFIILDLENVPNSFAEVCEHINLSARKDVHLLGFTNKNSEHIRKKIISESEYYDQSINLAKVLTVCKDAADIAIVFLVGHILGSTQTLLKCENECNSEITIKMHSLEFSVKTGAYYYYRFVLCTKDHFGETLKQLINGFGGNYVAENVSSILELRE